MRKFHYFLFVLERSSICYYIICMTVPLTNWLVKKFHFYVIAFQSLSAYIIRENLTNVWYSSNENMNGILCSLKIDQHSVVLAFSNCICG